MTKLSEDVQYIIKGDHISLPLGTSIYSIGTGKVIYSGWLDNQIGNCDIVQHLGAMRSIYGHLDKVFLKKEELINRGTVIELVGSSGKSTGDHLHFGLKWDANFVNPIHFDFASMKPKDFRETKQEIMIPNQVSCLRKILFGNLNQIIEGGVREYDNTWNISQSCGGDWGNLIRIFVGVCAIEMPVYRKCSYENHSVC